VEEFIRQGKRDKIICLMVDGDGSSDCFPASLRNEQPLAADARDNRDGKPNALLKVIAGMLSIPFDRLSLRELHRRRKQLISIGSLALVIITLTSSLALLALFSRQNAEQRLIQSEELISFMLKDFGTDSRSPLLDRSDSLGELDALDAMGAKVMDYFASLTLEDVGHHHWSNMLLRCARSVKSGRCKVMSILP